MDVWAVLLLVLVGTLLLAVLIAGFVLLIFTIVRSLGGHAGGWRRLVETYSTSHLPRGPVHKRQTLQIGAVVYKRCVTVEVGDEGLYLSVWRRGVLIPWHEFKRLGQATLYWQQVPLLTVGEPPVATITVPITVFELLRAKLPQQLLHAE